MSYEVYNSSNTALEYVREDFFLQGLQNSLDVDLYVAVVWLSQCAKQQNWVEELQNTWKWKVIFFRLGIGQCKGDAGQGSSCLVVELGKIVSEKREGKVFLTTLVG